MAHSYQEQIDRMWNLIKLNNQAKRKKFWLESISLSYILLEAELRLVLFAKGFSTDTIDNQPYLMNLANLAKDNGIITSDLWDKLHDFNTKRRQAIHGLVKGEIQYDDLEEPAIQFSELAGEIQGQWLTIDIGDEETLSEHINE